MRKGSGPVNMGRVLQVLILWKVCLLCLATPNRKPQMQNYILRPVEILVEKSDLNMGKQRDIVHLPRFSLHDKNRYNNEPAMRCGRQRGYPAHSQQHEKLKLLNFAQFSLQQGNNEKPPLPLLTNKGNPCAPKSTNDVSSTFESTKESTFESTNEKLSTFEVSNENTPLPPRTNQKAPLTRKDHKKGDLLSQNDESASLTVESSKENISSEEISLVSPSANKAVSMNLSTNKKTPLNKSINHKTPPNKNHKTPTNFSANESVPRNRSVNISTNKKTPPKNPVTSRDSLMQPSNEEISIIQSANNTNAPLKQSDNNETSLNQSTNTSAPIKESTDQPTNEKSPIKQLTNEEISLEESTKEKTPLEQSTNEKTPLEQSTNEKDPLKQPTNEETSLKQSTNEKVPLKESINNKAPLKQSTNEKSTLKLSTNDRAPIMQSANETYLRYLNDIVMNLDINGTALRDKRLDENGEECPPDYQMCQQLLNELYKRIGVLAESTSDLDHQRSVCQTNLDTCEASLADGQRALESLNSALEQCTADTAACAVETRNAAQLATLCDLWLKICRERCPRLDGTGSLNPMIFLSHPLYPQNPAYPHGWYYFSKCYEQVSWFEAEQFCKSKGMNLLNVETAAESQYIWSYINRILESEKQCTCSSFWIGLTSLAECLTWAWYDTGLEVGGYGQGFTDWWPDHLFEPQSRQCAAYTRRPLLQRRHYWSSLECCCSARFICEVPKCCYYP